MMTKQSRKTSGPRHVVMPCLVRAELMELIVLYAFRFTSHYLHTILIL